MEKEQRSTLKKTPSNYDILNVIENRWSPRTFKELPLSENELKTLFEAGRWAASSNNMQPWVIIWGLKGTKMYDRLFNCLDDFNQKWASNASALVITAFKKTTPDGKENFHALHDLGQFMANVAIQAQYNNIAIHQMAGLDHAKAKDEFKLPEEFHVATAVALGYYGGELDKLSSDLQDEELKERERKPQDTFVFNGNFNEDKFNQKQ